MAADLTVARIKTTDFLESLASVNHPHLFFFFTDDLNIRLRFIIFSPFYTADIDVEMSFKTPETGKVNTRY